MIVAIPEKDDYVWNLSTEKIPHMTLLFLGNLPADAPLEHIVEYVGHVAETSLSRFGLSVDRRGTLGPDEADVLFFEKGYYTENLENVRGFLLKDPAIFSAYNSTEQYPQWTPHLTLGYPDRPAKKDTRDYPGTNWVRFDRLAIWTGDFSGPEFRLRSDESMSVGMSDLKPDSELVEGFLEHYGVKGMRWGVRKQRSSSSGGAPSSTKATPKKSVDVGGSPTRSGDGRIKVAPKAKVASTQSHHTMSDEELRKAIARIDMQRRYAELTKPAPTKKEAAQALVAEIGKNVLKDVVQQQSKAVLNSLATKQLAKAGIVTTKTKKAK